MEKREGNYDLLRIISAIAVIMIHVSGTWFGSAIRDISKNGLFIEDIQSPVLICIYNSISKFAVPCFVMLSGAFILNNEKNDDYIKFYSKSFCKIGVPTVIFSMLYVLYRMTFCLRGGVSGIPELLVLLKDILKGSPMYHMWYLYMLIWIYAMVPVILRFKRSISERTFYKVSFIFLILAGISKWTSTVELNWDIGQSFEYLGYFMTGYSIRMMCKEKNNRKACIMIISGVLFEICAAGLQYKQMMDGIEKLKYEIVGPYCPLLVPASVLIFGGFTFLSIDRSFTKCSSLTLYIYLIHAGVWDFMQKIFYRAKGQDYLTDLDGGIWIMIFTVILFVISYYLSRIYVWMWDKIDKEKRITKVLVRMVHLQME